MVVCHCLRVSDRTIVDLIAHCEGSLEEICGRSGAGTNCGGCRDTIQTLVESGRVGLGEPVAVRSSPSFRRRRAPIRP